MTTSATALRTRLRTWALVAGLTGLVIALGAMIGGTFLWLFAALAVIFNLVGYFYSDRIALRVARAQPLSESDLPAIYGVVRRLAARAQIPTPRLYVMPGEQPNAFATGRDHKHAAIAATEGLLMTLPPEQIEGVLAHEMAHIKNRDILVSSIAAMILAPLGATLLQLGVSRQREYLADATAAELLGKAAPLADALESIERSQAPALEVNPVTAPMYIANPFSGGQVSRLFSTHPPLAMRVGRLRAYDRQRPRRATAARAVAA